MIRGGNWNNDARDLRVGNRNRNEPGNQNENLGFRCVRPCRNTPVGRDGLRVNRGARAPTAVQVSPAGALRRHLARPFW
ncbi:MAG: hypothetical protein HYV07_22255 [Deltaproteobacteria bacterium]|nr:hypothetical protein [Deltaproteobacteria bacterium]